MKQYEFDRLVVGAGSGGVRAARVAAQLGARVAIAEAHKFGGTCVNAGCIPKKLLVFASEFSRHCQDARGFGVHAEVTGFAWPALIAAKDREVARLNQLYQRLAHDAGATILRGRARLQGPNTIEIEGRTVSTRFVLIATGSAPIPADLPGGEHTITSDEAFALPALPERIVIVGGGYVGLEFAGIFRGLGARVALATRGEQILTSFDEDVREHLTRELGKRGIDIKAQGVPREVVREGRSLRVRLNDGTELEGDQVLWAAGRRPNTQGIGLEDAGVKLAADGAVQVDTHSRSSLANLFAVGDCTGGLALTPVAIADGQAAAHTMFGSARPSVAAERDLVPTAVFSQPPVAGVGLSEAAARVRGHDVEVFCGRFTPLKHRLSGRDAQTLVKLIVERRSQRVLGCHMVGEDAPEIVQGFAVALRCGATKAQFDATVGIHPTAAEEFVTLRSSAPSGA
jgi:glutathione reductase (NADPH)